jgi:hypothetical protein
MMRKQGSIPSRDQRLRLLVVTVSGGHAAALLLTTVPWSVSLALLAVAGIGAGRWTLRVIARLRAEEEGTR